MTRATLTIVAAFAAIFATAETNRTATENWTRNRIGEATNATLQAAKEYADAHGGDVQSVNGKTGTVVLAAADVHALPDTYTPPAAPVQSVNGKTGAVQLDYDDVGAWNGQYEVAAALELGYHGRHWLGGTPPYSLKWDSTAKRYKASWAVGDIPNREELAYLSDLDGIDGMTDNAAVLTNGALKTKSGTAITAANVGAATSTHTHDKIVDGDQEIRADLTAKVQSGWTDEWVPAVQHSSVTGDDVAAPVWIVDSWYINVRGAGFFFSTDYGATTLSWMDLSWTRVPATAETKLLTRRDIASPDPTADTNAVAGAKATGEALASKVDAIPGKGLSQNDYTGADKAEVAKVKDKADEYEWNFVGNTQGYDNLRVEISDDGEPDAYRFVYLFDNDELIETISVEWSFAGNVFEFINVGITAARKRVLRTGDAATPQELTNAISTNNPAFVSAVRNTPAPTPEPGEESPWGTWGTVGAAIAGIVAALKLTVKKLTCGTLEITPTNGVADVSDLFSESNTSTAANPDLNNKVLQASVNALIDAKVGSINDALDALNGEVA